ncbi:VQ motif-containing protein 9-like [Vicia villosa]|uniref:VQ motif-containing protein 9-like n=1 Tax=Vicia villosa TaxID=3911 RepID=UPI00273B6E68|nr:VQ motif-containing protein 9-like [Vicia villosa]
MVGFLLTIKTSIQPTGSPAHDHISTPPPIQQPKQQSSRLQRTCPPPLPHITNRPPPSLNNRPHLPSPQNFNFNGVNFNQSFPGFGRPQASLSLLLPFPTVHAAAESPISAYMRDLQNFVSTMDNKSFSGFSPLPPLPLPVSSHQPQPEQQPPPQQEEQEQQQVNQPPVLQPFQMSSSPVLFGCLNSQLASYPLLSSGLLFSPNSANLGFPQLPLSPTVPAPSPRWREI